MGKKKNNGKKRKKRNPRESEILRRREFELFAEWLALSPLLKLLHEDQLKGIGVDDPTEIELLKIKTQTDFANKFKLNIDTPTDWKKKDELWDLVDENQKQWGSRKTPSVLLGFYKKAVSESDAARVRLWLQYFKGWAEKSRIEHSGKIGLGMEQKIRTDPILKKAVKFYEDELKKNYRNPQKIKKHVKQEYRKRNNSGKHSGVDKGGKRPKRKRKSD